MMSTNVKTLLGLPETATDADVCAAVDRLIAERDIARLRIDDLDCAAQAVAADPGEGEVDALMRELSAPPRHPNAIPIALRQVRRLRALADKAVALEWEVSALRTEAARLRARVEHLETVERRASILMGERDALVLALRHARRALRFGMEAGDADVLTVAVDLADTFIRSEYARFLQEELERLDTRRAVIHGRLASLGIKEKA